MDEINKLLAWRLANDLRDCVQELATRRQVQRDLRFQSQLQDCAGAVSRNIAEGHGRIRPREFAQFLFVARGSIAELQDILRDGVTRGYWNEAEVTETRVYCRRAMGAIDGLIRRLRSPEANETFNKWEKRRSGPARRD
mgnify:CR=1 FL=1